MAMRVEAQLATGAALEEDPDSGDLVFLVRVDLPERDVRAFRAALAPVVARRVRRRRSG
jgi:hypothetical protein